jgi:hypothetical protein
VTVRELSEIVDSWENINNYEVVLAGITYWIGEDGSKDNFIVLYFRVER